jgi:uncharacterized membrane protein (Fun14 family)
MVGSNAHAHSSWIAKAKAALRIDGFTANKLIEVGIYWGCGFLTGYFLKRFSNAFVIIILTLLALFLLHQAQIINLSFNMDKLREFFGIVTTHDSSWLSAYLHWVKDNIILVLSFFIGFLMGIRLG